MVCELDRANALDLALRRELRQRGCVVRGFVGEEVLMDSTEYRYCEVEGMPRDYEANVQNAAYIVQQWLARRPTTTRPVVGGWWLLAKNGFTFRAFFAVKKN
jgi:hypothetical protein